MWASLALATTLLAQAQTGDARTLDVEFSVTGQPQVAVWLEDARGDFVDTLMVTRLVGTFGLGNRPGRGDFGGAYLWPYGRRENALPVWATRRGVEYPRIVFQDCKESWLGWHELVSSNEPFYCRPLTAAEHNVDAVSCPTTAFRTDKGIPLAMINNNEIPECAEIKSTYSETSYYPPRNDVRGRDPSRDWEGVNEFREMNDLDAVSRATPRSYEPYKVSWPIPAALAPGEYTVWVEVNEPFDFNASHNYGFFVDPRLSDYGLTIAGQPSVAWRVPITVSSSAAVSNSVNYAGYGSPSGIDGDLRTPDSTITTGVEGSGEGRLILNEPTGQDPYRVKVSFTPQADCGDASPPRSLSLEGADWAFVDLAYQTDDPNREIARYELRFAEGSGSIASEEDFLKASPGQQEMPVLDHGAQGDLRLDLPRPDTVYTVAVRAHNVCGETSDFVTLEVQTAIREFATVGWCFVATAAYGDDDDPRVRVLRQFRDEQLLPTAPGRKFVETYYKISPPIARQIARSPWMRDVVRAQLAPLVAIIETFR